MSWISSVGGFLASMWTSVYGLFSARGGTASTDGPGMIGHRGAAGQISSNHQRTRQYPATNLTAEHIAHALTFITPDDTAPVCLTLGQSCSAMRDRTSSYVFAQLHNVVRFTRCTPDQDEALLKLFGKARPTADIHTLALREVRARPVDAVQLVAARCPLQLKTLDVYKSDVTSKTAELAAHIAACSNLTSVTLSDCHVSTPIISSLMPTLLQSLPNLKKLDLSNNNLRVEGAVAIAAMDIFIDPSKMTNFKMDHLEQLDLGGNSLGNRGLEALLRAGFPGHATPKLNVLDLRHNALRDDGARTLLRFLALFKPNEASSSASSSGGKSACPELQVLELSDNEISKGEDGEMNLRTGFRGARIFL